MGTIFVARSVTLSKWGSDVGLSKYLFRLGYTDRPVREVLAESWAGEADWSLVKKEDTTEELSADALIDRAAAKEKMIDPNLYPRIKGMRGLFKISPKNVENHLLVARALSGEPDLLHETKLKPADFGAYLITNAKS